MTSFLSKLLSISLICLTAAASATDLSENFRATIRHIEGGGIGYSQGYTTLEGFFTPYSERAACIPFLDIRGHVFDNGKMAANAGIGFRRVLGCRVYGLNAYFDYRDATRANYNQIGLGFESLGTVWDLRINGYLPLGRQSSSPFDAEFNGFSGNNLILSERFQFAMKGIDAELGCHLGRSRFFDFYAAAGPYYYLGANGVNTWGGKARLAGVFNEYLTLELSDSYDKLFHNNFQCQLALTIPFGGKSERMRKSSYNSCKIANPLLRRLIQPVGREEIIVVGSDNRNVIAIDPLTGEPFFFVFVDNTSSSDGTYESPYPTLAEAQANSKPNDIIYVFPGDGTTTGMDAGITLKYNQNFWGSGVGHFIETTKGDFIIPPQSLTYPQMTNTAGDGITLASINEVSGFIIADVAGNGIVGTNVEDIQISSCTIDHSQADQIHLDYSGSTGVLALNDLSIINGDLKGVYINSTSASTTCTISDCVISTNANNSIDAIFANEATFRLTNNTIVNNGNANTFDFQGSATLLVANNVINNNTSVNLAPLHVIAATNPLTATVENNTFNDNVCGAMHFILNDTSLAELSVANNTITNNGIGAIGSLGAPLFIDPNGTTAGNCRVNLADNTYTGNAGAAFYCFDGGFDDFQVTSTNNLITDNLSAGLVFANDCNTFTLTATNNVIANGGDHGITTGGGNLMENATINISNNQITGNTGFGNGIAISHEGEDVNFVAENNNISNNDGTGILFFSTCLCDNIEATIANNTINNNLNSGSNAASGIDIENFINFTGSITNNTLNNPTSPGFYIGSLEPTPTVCLELVGNVCNTEYDLNSGTGTFNLSPCNVETVNTGAIVEIGTITHVQSCPSGAPCP